MTSCQASPNLIGFRLKHTFDLFPRNGPYRFGNSCQPQIPRVSRYRPISFVPCMLTRAT